MASLLLQCSAKNVSISCILQAAIQQAATQWPVQSMTPTLAADSVALALQQLQRDSQQQQIIAKHVKSIEAKLNALEGSVVTAGNLFALNHSLVSCFLSVTSMHNRNSSKPSAATCSFSDATSVLLLMSCQLQTHSSVL